MLAALYMILDRPIRLIRCGGITRFDTWLEDLDYCGVESAFTYVSYRVGLYGIGGVTNISSIFE
jgi:hypothetical protein